MTIDFNKPYRYSALNRCKECNIKTICYWISTGLFKGYWLCYECDKDYSEALADIVKAAEKRLERLSNETTN